MVNDINILASTYFDTGTSYRREKVKNEDTGVTETKWTEINKNFKCAISRSQRTELMQVDGVGNLYESYALFTYPSLDFQTGDKLVIKSLSGTFEYSVYSRPFKHVSHQEMFIVDKDRV